MDRPDPDPAGPDDRLGARGGERPRLVLVADQCGWAFENIAAQLQRHLRDAFDVRILYLTEYPDWIDCIHAVVVTHEADYAHFFWREYLYEVLRYGAAARVEERHGIPEGEFVGRFARVILTLSVYDETWVSDDELAIRAPFLWLVDGYAVCSERLRRIYTRPFLPAPDVVTEDGVDLEVFQPGGSGPGRDDQRPLVVGWAGNSDWNRTEHYDPKGVRTILEPALARLASEGVPVEARFADAARTPRPRADMPDFYRGLDVYVCTSEIEGTPNPVLEAMACGVPIVSTDVGVVSQVFGPEQRRFVLAERSIDAVVGALRELARHRELLPRLAAENLERIASWSWAQQMPKWRSLFRTAADRHDRRVTEQRRHALSVVRQAVRALEEQIARQAEALRASERLVEERWAVVQSMERMIADRDAASAAQTTMIRERDALISSQDEIVRQRDARLGELAVVVHERDALVQSLQDRIRELEADVRYARSARGAVRNLARRALRRD